MNGQTWGSMQVEQSFASMDTKGPVSCARDFCRCRADNKRDIQKGTIVAGKQLCMMLLAAHRAARHDACMLRTEHADLDMENMAHRRATATCNLRCARFLWWQRVLGMLPVKDVLYPTPGCLRCHWSLQLIQTLLLSFTDIKLLCMSHMAGT